MHHCFNGAALNSARKYNSTRRIHRREDWLQWGRAEFSAEMRTAGARIPENNTLQWGRAEFSAEMTPSAQNPQPKLPLQWGRAEFSAEMPVRPYEPMGY